MDKEQTYVVVTNLKGLGVLKNAMERQASGKGPSSTESQLLERLSKKFDRATSDRKSPKITVRKNTKTNGSSNGTSKNRTKNTSGSKNRRSSSNRASA